MVDQELVERVTRLPVPQRLELIELLTHSLRAELAAEAHEPVRAPAPSAGAAAEDSARELAAIARLAGSLHLDLPPDSSLHQLRGAVPSGAVPMTKDAVRDLIAGYLLEKHS
ncbi:MAG TPA: hypothetical protein VF897_04770 [Roseiflexaceae bacterium]